MCPPVTCCVLSADLLQYYARYWRSPLGADRINISSKAGMTVITCSCKQTTSRQGKKKNRRIRGGMCKISSGPMQNHRFVSLVLPVPHIQGESLVLLGMTCTTDATNNHKIHVTAMMRTLTHSLQQVYFSLKSRHPV